MEAQLVERLEKAVARLEAISSSSSSSRSVDFSGEDAVVDPSIVALDDLIANYVGRVYDAAQKIGGKVLESTEILRDAFSALRELLVKVKQTQKPDMAGLGEFLKPLNEVIMKANALTEGRRSDFFNHQKSISDSLAALAWIAYTGKDCGMSMPIAHVEESWQMAEFYSNKVLIEYKNKDPNHVEWAKALKELYLPGLRDYVKSFYPLGPVWSTSSKATVGMSAVFQEISSGGAATSGLRKVTDDMKAKNRADRSGVVPVVDKEPRAKSSAFSKTGPPKLELQMGRKWAVENQIGKRDLVISECDSKQSVYVFGCKDSVLLIQGKVNNITADKCTKTGILFKDVVAACEIVNCNGVEVQCQGSAPTISVDNTSGCQIYLSKDSLEASITTAKSSEINVMVPASEADGDWVEHSLPQQYIHTFKDGQFVTSPVSHSGG
uniref:Adenylyl cyclase-associated protein n=1 Tax=Chenopodium quinoa TaxID=63459 RepID=A0A803LDS2_CHEQI